MLVALLFLCMACGGAGSDAPGNGGAGSGGAAADPADPVAGSASDGDGPVRIVFLGDSLTAGFGLEQEQAFPARVAERLEAAGHEVTVINAGTSGDTTAGGADRIDWLLRQSPDIVVLALGGNDGLRGLDLEMTERNLRRIVERSQAAEAQVLMAGMMMPPNYGPDYTERFRALFPRVAGDLEVPLIPFLLEGVGGVPELNMPDGIHPTAEGHRKLADNVMPYLEPLVRDLR
ncbi:hypothetical protein ABI59_20000 [Acidobacteria bacterium Mor1]|nr:hypothetical protein ABI59_20000 [Acidobacteria bacterium Mor1]